MQKFYKISCVVMGGIGLIALAVTLIVGATGISPTASKLGLYTVVGCLAAMTVLTILCLFVTPVGGRLPYRIGVYLLHVGAVVLMAGFLVTELTTVKGNFEMYCGRRYSGFQLDNPRTLEFDEGDLVLDEVSVEYYSDGVSPKHYEAVLGIYDGNGVQKDQFVLTVNHPVYINGCKIYLNSLMGDFGARLIIKYNPGEYIVLAGIVVLLAGIFLACFSGFRKTAGKKGGGQK